MSLGLDSSVVLRLLTRQPLEEAERARLAVESAPNGVSISDLVIAESYFALRHHYGVPHSETVVALRDLINDPRVIALGIAPRVLSQPDAMRLGKNVAGFVDRLIIADYSREVLQTVTFDRPQSREEGVVLL